MQTSNSNTRYCRSLSSSILPRYSERATFFLTCEATKRLVFLSFLALIFTLFSATPSSAATITSAGDGNWNSTTPNAPWPGGTVPSATDDVVILPTHDITVTANASINSITLGSNNTATTRILTVNSGITLTVTAGITMQNDDATNMAATITGAGTITCASLTVGGTTTTLTGDASTILTSTITSLSISGNLNINGEDDGNDDNNATLALASGSVTVGGTVNTDEEAGSVVTLTLNTGAATGTLFLAGATPFTDTVGTPTFDAAGSSATVNYSGATQTVRAVTYNNLTLSGSGTKTLASALTVNNDVTINSGVTLDVAAITLTVSSGTIIINGTLDFSDSTGSATSTGTSVVTMGSTGLIRTADATGLGPVATASLIGTWTTTTIDTNGTVEYNRNATSGQTVTDRDYNNLVITGSTQIKTWTRGAARTVNGSVTINASAPFTLAGNQTLNVKGNWSNSGTFTTTTGTIAFTGTVLQNLSGSSATAFFNLTINNTSGLTPSVTFNQNASVASTATLTLTTDLNVINPSLLTTTGATSVGAGDVIGGVRRTDLTPGTARSFGNVNVQVTIGGSGTLTTMTVNLAKQAPTSFPAAVTRTYALLPAAGSIGSGPLPTLRLRYKDAELNGNTEGTLELWRLDGATWQPKGGTPDTVNNHVTALVDGFSSWVISGPNAPTDVALISFDAKSYDGKVVLNWQTGYEVDNLGFNVYREVAGKRTRVNTDIIAGSALLAGAGTVLRTGESYVWTDTLSKTDQDAQYWLEDIDLKGTSTLSGPFAVTNATADDGAASRPGRSPLLSNIASGDSNSRDTSLTRPVERTAKLSAIAIKPPGAPADLAGMSAVKISIKREGFYRVTQPELLAAGLSSGTNPRNLQLFVNGQELPISVTGEQDENFGPADAVEFYAYGLDTPSTDARVYWLVAGQALGQRINKQQSQGGPGTGGTFLHTVERKDKTVYFPALKNGEADNFFGSTVTSTPVNQVLNLQNVATGDVKHADLEIVLQGVTDSAHQVKALFNGAEIGTINFTGQQQGILQLQLPHSQLLEGDNTVNLVAEGGSTDTSLVAHIRISYYHTFKADNNALKLKAQSGEQVTINGFASAGIRVIDITDPNSVTEIAGIVDTDKTSFSVTASVTGAGERTLLAIGDSQIKQAAAITANQPSKLRTTGQGADLIILAHKDFIPNLAQLKARRESQGLSVMILNVEDAYDEFSNGHKSPQAIKDFFAYAKSSWKRKPQFALLAGDATFDPRNYLGLGDNDFVPTKLIETGVNETASDDWLVNFNGDFLPDIAVGRLPVRTPQETTALVAKIISYDLSPRSEEVLLVADRNEGFDFETASAELRQVIPTRYRVNEVMRGSTDDETARNNVLEATNRGQKIINYLGHGSTRVWSGGMLTANDAPSLTNTNQLSVIVAMTCLNGFFQHPTIESFAEAMLKAGQGGAVAVWASSGMTAPNGQKPIDREMVQQLFSAPNVTLGEATVKAKALTADQDTRRTWILFGDPSTRIR